MNNLITNTIDRINIREGDKKLDSFLDAFGDRGEIQELLKDVEYDGLALALFEVKDLRNNRVKFSKDKTTIKKDTKAVFLEEIKEKRNDKLVARKVVGQELVEKLTKKKPLFVVHGWQGRPNIFLNRCIQNQRKFDKYQLIPVMWPGNGNKNKNNLGNVTLLYEESRKDANLAAKAMNEALISIDDKVPEKDILCVSMGNWLLQELAKKNGGLAFNNIFMSAADVDEDIFEEKEGKDIVEMLSKDQDGKVYVFHHDQDEALSFSSDFLPLFSLRGTRHRRLGLDGATKEGIKNYKEKVENVNVSGDIEKKDEHGYAFDDFAVEFYQKHA